MPLNATYLAHQSVPITTQIPSIPLTLSTLIPPPNATTLSNNVPLRSTSSIVQFSNLEPNEFNHSPFLPPTKSISNRQDQETSMTPVVVQTTRCSVSTQTNDDYCTTHQPCHDVSICPCVQIYARSEQLFMSNMAIFFRNSIAVTPPEPSTLSITIGNNKNDQVQEFNHQTISSTKATSSINHIEIDQHSPNNVKINRVLILKFYSVFFN